MRGVYERLRPPVQLADPVPPLERRRACAGLELPVLPDAYTETPGSLALAHPPTLAIASEHFVGTPPTTTRIEPGPYRGLFPRKPSPRMRAGAQVRLCRMRAVNLSVRCTRVCV